MIRSIYVYVCMAKEAKRVASEEEAGLWLAADLLAMVQPQTDQVLRQRCRVMADLAALARKEVQQ